MNFTSISRTLQGIRRSAGRFGGPGRAAEAVDSAGCQGGGIPEKLLRGSAALLIGILATHGILIPVFRALRPAASTGQPRAQVPSEAAAQTPVEPAAQTYRVPLQRHFRFPVRMPSATPWTDASVTACLDQLEALANDPLRKPFDEP